MNSYSHLAVNAIPTISFCITQLYFKGKIIVILTKTKGTGAELCPAIVCGIAGRRSPVAGLRAGQLLANFFLCS